LLAKQHWKVGHLEAFHQGELHRAPTNIAQAYLPDKNASLKIEQLCPSNNKSTLIIDDGRIEIDSNIVERSIRPIALNRKNALFAGSDGGGEHWAIIASLIETCKLNGVDPQTYLADVLTKIVNDHPNSRIDDLLPSAYASHAPLQLVA
jgi:hypothetical protein